VPEGDTLARIAQVLGRVLVGQTVTAARGRPGGAQLERVGGSTIENVEARGKHLLIAFSNGLTLHSHLGLNGEWHRYRPGERWHVPASRAVAVIETPVQVAVCFDAPTVELIETRALAIHPVVNRLGSDVARDSFDPGDALRALRDPSRADAAIGDALLDQRAVAGLGNVYRSELCFLERVNPFTPVSEVSDETLMRLLVRGTRLTKANSRGGARITTAPGTPGNTYVYGRSGRACRRCGTPISSATSRAPWSDTPRRVYWCPSCQPASRRE
jgi:endonuclease VIII